jgi:NADH-quinone oxidoreductase subunit F
LELLNQFVNGNAKSGDIEKLEDMLTHITELSACGLGQAAGVAIKSALKQGRAEFEEAISA